MSIAHALTPNPNADRRQHERYLTPPMYTGVAVRPLDDERYLWDGHAYNVSAGGVQFELDRALDPGTSVAMRIDLPGTDNGPGRAVFVIGNVVWADDDGVRGPVRHAVAFTQFARAGDEARLAKQLGSGRFAVAA